VKRNNKILKSPIKIKLWVKHKQIHSNLVVIRVRIISHHRLLSVVKVHINQIKQGIVIQEMDNKIKKYMILITNQHLNIQI
jgi:hypothetical protein